MRRVLVLIFALGAACTLTTSLEGYAGRGPLMDERDASSEAGSVEGGADTFVITALVLVNADTAQVVPGYEAMATSATIPPSLAKWNIRAEVRGDPGSVQFDVDGKHALTENNSPFYLCGDNEGGVGACEMASGEHTLRVIPYALDERLGAAGNATTLTLTIP